MGGLISAIFGSSKTTEEELSEVREQITDIEDKLKTATGTEKDALTKQLAALKETELMLQLEIEEEKLKEKYGKEADDKAKEVVELNGSINALTKSLEETRYEKNTIVEAIKEIEGKIGINEKTKQNVDAEIAKIIAEIETVTQSKSTIDPNLDSESKDRASRDINSKISTLEAQSNIYKDQLKKIDDEIIALQSEKTLKLEKEVELNEIIAKLTAELVTLNAKRDKIYSEQNEATTKLQTEVDTLKKEIAEKKAVIEQLCQQALIDLKSIEATVSTLDKTDDLQTLLNNIEKIFGCNSTEYNKQKKLVIELITNKISVICTTETTRLTELCTAVPTTKYRTELQKMVDEVSTLTKCNSVEKQNALVKFNTAVNLQNEIFDACDRDFATLSDIKSKLETPGVDITEINTLFIESLKIEGCDIVEHKKLKQELSDLYNKLVADEIKKISDACLSTDITFVENPNKTFEENLADAQAKYNSARQVIDEYIQRLEKIYAIIPESHRKAIAMTEILAPINAFLKQAEELEAGLADDLHIYRAKQLFSTLLTGSGSIGGSESDQIRTDHPMNVHLMGCLNESSYKANMMFAEFQPILCPIEDTKGPIHNNNVEYTTSYLANYLGTNTYYMTVIDNNGTCTIKYTTDTGKETKDICIATAKGNIVNSNKGGNAVITYTEENGNPAFAIPVKSGTLGLQLINTGDTYGVQSYLTRDSVESKISTIKFYKFNGTLYYNEDGIWKESTGMPCNKETSEKLSSERIGENFYVTEEIDCQIYKINTTDGGDKYEYTVTTKQPTVTALRKKLIRYTTRIHNMLVKTKEYEHVNSLVKSFMQTQTRTWTEFFKQGKDVLSKIHDYYFKLLERYTIESFKNNLHPETTWYHLPSTYRVYIFEEELECATKLLMNQVFRAVMGKETLGSAEADAACKCFHYMNPLDLYSEKCFIFNENDRKFFDIPTEICSIGFTSSKELKLLLERVKPQQRFEPVNKKLDTYANAKNYITGYFEETIKEGDMFVTVPQLNIERYGDEYVDKTFGEPIITGKSKDGSENKAFQLFKLTDEQKMFYSMYALMDYDVLADQIYSDTIVSALQFDLVLCYNKKKTTMSICHNDITRGARIEQTLPFIFGRANAIRDDLAFW